MAWQGVFGAKTKPAAANPVWQGHAAIPAAPAAPAWQGHAALAPAPAPVYNPPVYQAPAAYAGGGGFAGGGGGGGGGISAPAPAPKMSDDDWLAGDSEFKAQENEYNRALDEFRGRIDKKKKNYDDDYKQSEQVTNQNKAQSLAGLGEDFASRGMSYSGVFDQSRTDNEDNFKRQLANLLTVKNRSDQAANDDLSDYEQENELSRGNARRNALARFANSQSLI